MITVKQLHFSTWWGGKPRVVIEDSDGVYHGAVTIGDKIDGSRIIAFEIGLGMNVVYRTENGAGYNWDDESVVIKRLS